MVRVGTIAVDGTRMAANASRDATVDYEQLARVILEEAAEVDAAEDEQFGDRRGDELPEQLRTGDGRQAWLRDAKLGLEDQRAREARPVCASARRGCGRPSAGSRRNCGLSSAPTRPMRLALARGQR